MIIFLILASVAYAWADCGDPPGLDSHQKGVSVYRHRKVVFESGESGGKKTTAYDHLIVWNRNPKELCFSITTISSQLHECYLDGKATKVRQNVYSYSENNCHAVLTFIKDKIKVVAKGSRGNYCVGEDLGDNNGGCGMNTSIDFAIYTEQKNRP